MRAPPFTRVRFGVVVGLLCGALGCSGQADRGRPAESTAASISSSDVPAPRTALASDATLVIEVAPAVAEALRAVTDSFGAREAIKVELTSLAFDTSGTMVTVSPRSDLVVVSGDLVPRLPADSSSWTLAFAAWRAPRTDSLVRGDSMGGDSATRAPTRPTRRRRAVGRRADSLRADSARRMALQLDSARAARARADSARVLVLTIPLRAPNSSGAERLVRYILTEGRETLRRSGLEVLPRLVMHGDAGPLSVRAVVDTVIPHSPVRSGDSGPPS